MKKLKKNKGITLIALVITIIVLLILAGVSLSAVFSQDGIFRRAKQATDKYGQAKARETLELALSDAQMQKYESELTDEQLDNMIGQVGSLIPKEDENSNNQLVIVDGYIFEIDRSVPKIVDYKGPTDRIIITAQVTKTEGWNQEATVTGTITKYGGGSVISSTATAKAISTGSTSTITNFPTTGGRYTISNITEDTDITITASADDGKPAVTRTIEVRLVRDTTPPVISGQTVTASGMKITIKADATDPESGIASFTYNVTGAGTATPEAGKNFTSGVPLELTTSALGSYTVTFTATNGAGKSATTEGITVTTRDLISIADLKDNINASNWVDYLGMKVNYKPGDTKAWRVFYYDATGTEFGDGAGTIYLKRDYDTTTKTKLTNYTSHVPADGGALMRQLNPKWAISANGQREPSAWLTNAHLASWLCDSTQWTTYKTNEAKYAIGAAPIEMWCKAQDAYRTKYDASASTISCDIINGSNGYGYGYKINGGDLEYGQGATVVSSTSIPQSAVIATGNYQWLASPTSSYSNHVGNVNSINLTGGAGATASGVCPVVCLN